jgi:predicted Zn-dependent protease
MTTFRTATSLAALVALVAGVTGSPVRAQSLGQIVKGAQQGIKAYQDLNFTDAEEQQLGADVSARLRDKYGVVQDLAVHRYVTLAGTALAQESARPTLRWTFIVLDTDGINAFAAPGGFVHITRGALALIHNEAELADVLAHEIGHVTAKHTIRAIQKSKGEGWVTSAATRSDLLKGAADKLYAATWENAYSRGDEMDADKIGITLANKAGYAPTGLTAFLSRLAERNKGLTDRSGIFASHPETQARLDAMTKLISAQKLTSAALVQPRYTQAINYKLVPVDQLAQVAPPGATPAKSEPAKSGGSGKTGLSGLDPLGKQNSSSGTVAASGSRGVNPDRDAKGGPNKALVVVTVSAADVTAFRKGIS